MKSKTWKIRPDYREAINHLKSKSNETIEYLEHLEKVLNIEVGIGVIYVFSKIELLFREILYYKIVNEFKTQAGKTWEIICKEHITRDNYCRLYKNCFEVDLDDKLMDSIKNAQKIRDNIMHGSPSHKYLEEINCIKEAINFIEDFSNFTKDNLGFNPTANLKGRIKGGKINDKQTYLLMKGLGFLSKK